MSVCRGDSGRQRRRVRGDGVLFFPTKEEKRRACERYTNYYGSNENVFCAYIKSFMHNEGVAIIITYRYNCEYKTVLKLLF